MNKSSACFGLYKDARPRSRSMQRFAFNLVRIVFRLLKRLIKVPRSFEIGIVMPWVAKGRARVVQKPENSGGYPGASLNRDGSKYSTNIQLLELARTRLIITRACSLLDVILDKCYVSMYQNSKKHFSYFSKKFSQSPISFLS